MPESASCHPLFRIRDNGIVEVLDGREKGKKFELRSRQSAFQTKAFPLGCRLFSKTSTGKTFYLCEFPPSVRDVAWIPGPNEWDEIVSNGKRRKLRLSLEDESRRQFRLAFPFTVFAVMVHPPQVEMTAFFRPHPIQSASDFLCAAGLLPNDTIIHPAFPSGEEESAQVDAAIEKFWCSTFASEGNPGFQKYRLRIPELASVWDWEFHSAQNPLFVLEAKWKPVVENLSRLHDPGSDHPNVSCLLQYFQDSEGNSGNGLRGLEWHPASVCVANKTFVSGDQVKILSADGLHKRLVGKTIRIAGFLGREPGSERFVFFEGDPRPVSVREIRLEKAPISLKQIDVEGVLISPLMQIHLDSDSGQKKFETVTIRALRQVQDGSIMAQDQRMDWFPLTSASGRLLPSVRLLVPRLTEDGKTFTCGKIKLTVGEAVKVNGAIRCVKHLWHETEGKRYWASVEQTEDLLLSEDGIVRFEGESFPFEMEKRLVLFYDRTLDLRETDFLFSLKAGSPLFGLLKVDRFVDVSGSRGELSIELCLKGVKKRLPVIRDGEWVWDPRAFCPVSFRWKAGTLELSRGMILEYYGEPREVLGLEKGQKLTISCFLISSDSPAMDVVLFTNGLSASLSKECLAKLRISGCRQSLANQRGIVIPEPVSLARPVLPDQDEDGDERNPFNEGDIVLDLNDNAVTVIGLDGNECEVQYEDGETDWSSCENLRLQMLSFTRFFTCQGRTTFWIKKENHVALSPYPAHLLAEYFRVKNKGRDLGWYFEDENEQPLQYGDLVLVGPKKKQALVVLKHGVEDSDGGEQAVFFYVGATVRWAWGVSRKSSLLKKLEEKYPDPKERQKISVDAPQRCVFIGGKVMRQSVNPLLVDASIVP